ncbi:MAG: hypothetical protein PHS41_07115 [Victivallaceae bacterium]|nr:hypothetical protein [Victivallaceae bacterium]
MFDLEKLRSSLLIEGDEFTAYRDPAAYWRDGKLYLFFSIVENHPGSLPLSYVGMCVTEDLVHFSKVRKLTPGDPRFNYSSPGNVILHNGTFYLCCQTYCRENAEKFGNERCRIFLLSSPDLEHWSEPKLIMVKGDDVPEKAMGRMIDPFLFRDSKTKLFWCFYKQDGCKFSTSSDLCHWMPRGQIACGENVSVFADENRYYLWHSPQNGIGEMVSDDLCQWHDTGRLFTFGQKQWPWASGRITAGTMLDLRKEPQVGQALCFFHGSGGRGEEECFDNYASIGVAWSYDCKTWEYR